MKVLIISHNPICTFDNMGKTFLSLFSQFSKDELCQLYVYPTIPDVNKCSSFFRITDKDVLDSYFNFGKINSKIISDNNINTSEHKIFENETYKKAYKNKNTSIKLILRDIMWAFSHYYNKKLKQWLNTEKPTCIFLAPGWSKFIYKIANKISKKLNIPIVTYVCDDYYFVDAPKELGEKIQFLLLKSTIKKTMKNTSLVVTICDKLKDQYSSYFGVNAETIMTGSNYSIKNTISVEKDIFSLTFLGGLGYKRYESLLDIGLALDKINFKNSTNYKLKIYANPKYITDEINLKMKEIKSIDYCGYLSGSEFEDVFYSADCLIHVESFDKEQMNFVKNSVSTKIADSLGSGIPFLAYGPSEVASMEYLVNNKCAFVITDKNKLQEKLKNFLDDYELRKVITENGVTIAKNNHDSKLNSERLYNILNNISK